MDSSKVVYGLRALIIVWLAIPTVTVHAAASADLMKKCREMMIKTYPPPPVGTAGGNAKQQRDYFKSCVANKGNMEQK